MLWRTCCCGVLSGMKMLPNPADFVDSSYQAAVDPALCDSCGDCLERCQMGAINSGETSYAVDTKRCIGCGLCASSCEKGAITLHEREVAPRPEGDFYFLLDKISRERGLEYR